MQSCEEKRITVNVAEATYMSAQVAKGMAYVTRQMPDPLLFESVVIELANGAVCRRLLGCGAGQTGLPEP